jgi:hypothetical protein
MEKCERLSDNLFKMFRSLLLTPQISTIAIISHRRFLKSSKSDIRTWKQITEQWTNLITLVNLVLRFWRGIDHRLMAVIRPGKDWKDFQFCFVYF